MAETKKKEAVAEDVQVNEAAKPVDELTQAKQELELMHKRCEEIEEQNKQLITSAQKLYQENQTLRASLKAIASLL